MAEKNCSPDCEDYCKDSNGVHQTYCKNLRVLIENEEDKTKYSIICSTDC